MCLCSFGKSPSTTKYVYTQHTRKKQKQLGLCIGIGGDVEVKAWQFQGMLERWGWQKAFKIKSGNYKFFDQPQNPEVENQYQGGTYTFTSSRAKGSPYKEQCALFAVPTKQNDDDDDEEDGDGLDGEAETDIISEATAGRVKDIGVKFAKNYENNSKKWLDTKNTATFGYILNTKYSKLVDVIGKHSTYDAVAKLYGGYFDDGTFSDIAEDVIPLYFHDGENVERAIKELEYRHRN